MPTFTTFAPEWAWNQVAEEVSNEERHCEDDYSNEDVEVSRNDVFSEIRDKTEFHCLNRLCNR